MQQSARVICDSIGPNLARVTTVEVDMLRFIHPELLRHRLFSFSVASSRAIPYEKQREQVANDPMLPVHFPKQHRGMQGTEVFQEHEHFFDGSRTPEEVWLLARNQAVITSKWLSDGNVSKQLTNRLLEPWVSTRCVITATNWENFFMLRHPWHMEYHKDAWGKDIEGGKQFRVWEDKVNLNFPAEYNIQDLAIKIKAAMNASTPRQLKEGDWHLPFLTEDDFNKIVQIPGEQPGSNGFTRIKDPLSKEVREAFIKVSAAKCARTSYGASLGKSVEDDIKLADMLMKDNHMCYDNQTEVLTSTGWKLWADCDQTEKLASVNYRTGEVNFESPSHWHVSDFNGQLYYVQSQQVDLAVTLNHNMVVSHRSTCPDRKQRWSEFFLDAAQNVQNKVRRYLKSGNLQAEGIDLPLPVELLGFFIGDGYSNGTEYNFHLKVPRKIKYLKSLGVSLRERKGNSYAVLDKEVATWLRQNCYTEDKQKKLPDNFLEMSNAQVAGLFDGLKNSDGSLKRNTWVYSTSSEILADQIQALANTHGISASFNYGYPEEHCKSGFFTRLNFTDRTTPEVGISQNGRSTSTTEVVKPYIGKVYCATVSTGALMVRRNKKVVVSGNSPFEHQAQAINECFIGTVAEGECLSRAVNEMPKGLEARIIPSINNSGMFDIDFWSRNFQGFVQARSLYDT